MIIKNTDFNEYSIYMYPSGNYFGLIDKTRMFKVFLAFME